MDWKKTVGKGLNQGLDQSKVLLEKVKKQALTIGEQTLLNTEIKELGRKKELLFQELGGVVYTLLEEEGRSTVSLRTPELKDFFTDIEKVKSELKAKELLLEKEEKK